METKSDIIIEHPSPDDHKRSLSSNFTRDVITLSGGSIIAQAVVVIASPVLTRLYLPDVFGIAALFLAIVTPISTIACLRYDAALMLPESEEEASNILGTAIVSVITISTLTFILSPLFKNEIIRLFNAPNFSNYLWLIGPTVFLRGVFSALSYWNSRQKKFLRLSIAEISASCGTIPFQIIAAIKYVASSGSLIGGYIFGSAFSTILLGFGIFKNNTFLNKLRLKKMLNVAQRYRKFPLVDIWGVFFNNLSWQLPALMLAAFFSPATVGYYALADRIVKIPMLLGGRAISKVFYQQASEISLQQQNLSILVKNVFKILTALSLLPALLLGLLGQDIIKIVFGTVWAESGLYLQILSLWMFVWFISSPLSTLFLVFERQELALIIHVFIFMTRLISFLIGGLLKNVYIALGLFAGTGVIVYGVLLIWSMKQVNISLSHIFEIFFRYFMYCLPVIFLLTLFKYWLRMSSHMLLVSALPMVLIYYVGVYRNEYTLLSSLGVIKR